MNGDVGPRQRRKCGAQALAMANDSEGEVNRHELEGTGKARHSDGPFCFIIRRGDEIYFFAQLASNSALVMRIEESQPFLHCSTVGFMPAASLPVFVPPGPALVRRRPNHRNPGPKRHQWRSRARMRLRLGVAKHPVHRERVALPIGSLASPPGCHRKARFRIMPAGRVAGITQQALSEKRCAMRWRGYHLCYGTDQCRNE